MALMQPADPGLYPWPGCLKRFYSARRHPAAGAVPRASSSGAQPVVIYQTGDSVHGGDVARSSWGRRNASHHASFAVERACNSESGNSHTWACLSRKDTSQAVSRHISSSAHIPNKDWSLRDYRGGDHNKYASCIQAYRVLVSICR